MILQIFALEFEVACPRRALLLLASCGQEFSVAGEAVDNHLTLRPFLSFDYGSIQSELDLLLLPPTHVVVPQFLLDPMRVVIYGDAEVFKTRIAEEIDHLLYLLGIRPFFLNDFFFTVRIIHGIFLDYRAAVLEHYFRQVFVIHVSNLLHLAHGLLPLVYFGHVRLSVSVQGVGLVLIVI